MGFIDDLERENREHLTRLDAVRDESSLHPTPQEVVKRLRFALRQEMEAAEIAALWMPSTAETDIKLTLAKMCGDEAEHYRLIAARVQAFGEDEGALCVPQGRTPFFDYLASLTHPVERLASACFTREAVGYVRNEQFIEFCTMAEDWDTARMYRDHIQPDEWAHVVHGRALLEKYATTPETQELARAAARRTLEMAEVALDTIVHKMGLSNAPGC